MYIITNLLIHKHLKYIKQYIMKTTYLTWYQKMKKKKAMMETFYILNYNVNCINFNDMIKSQKYKSWSRKIWQSQHFLPLILPPKPMFCRYPTWSPAPIASSILLTCTPSAILDDCSSTETRTLHVL